MAPIDLNQYRAFAAVHETSSFTLAAKRLGVPRSTVSRAVYALEESLRVLLFQRTTRRVQSTTEGRSLYARVAPALSTLEAPLPQSAEPEEPSGTLRISATADLATYLLAEAITRFTARYQKMKVEVDLSNALVDLYDGSFDLALRIRGGALKSSTLVARKVGTFLIQLYASPQYLAQRGAPRSPADLRDHELVGFRDAPAGRSLPALLSALPTPRIVADDMVFRRELIRNGGGLGVLPAFLAGADLAAGRLVQVLPRWSALAGNVFLVHSSRRLVPRKITAFRDVLFDLLRQKPMPAAD
jgi:DNA-binding transcriptional LysR family regulator